MTDGMEVVEKEPAPIRVEELTEVAVKLAARISTLEKKAEVRVSSTDGGTDYRPALVAALKDLKTFRTRLMASGAAVDDKLKELAKVKEENSKLRYQVKHLKRSLEEEERVIGRKDVLTFMFHPE